MPTPTPSTHAVPRKSKRSQPDSPIPGYLTTAQIAERYGVWQDHVGLLCRTGALPAVRVGWMWLVKEADWLEYEQHKSTKGAPRGPREEN